VDPTVTDANLLLGRLLEDEPLAGGLALDRAASERAVGELARNLGLATRACAEGIVRIAEAEMLAALRLVTVERGVDPRGFVLMPFGGAGPMHAASMAAELGIERVLCPGASGVLCALGLAAAAPRRDASRTVMLSGAELSAERVSTERDELIARASAALGEQPARTRVRYELRYRGQSFELPVELGDDAQAASAAPDALAESFAQAHEERYGYSEPDGEVELVTLRASVWGRAPALHLSTAGAPAPAHQKRDVVFEGRELASTVLRGTLPAGTVVRGPALCAQADATAVVPPGWSGAVDETGALALRRET
jgi:N-methylhydantoinase A